MQIFERHVSVANRSVPATPKGNCSDNRVSGDDFAVELGAELRDTAQGWVLGVVEPETLGESCGPFEIVHERPEEKPLHGQPGLDGAVEAVEIVPQEHDTVRIENLPAFIDDILAACPAFADDHLGGIPEILCVLCSGQ